MFSCSFSTIVLIDCENKAPKPKNLQYQCQKKDLVRENSVGSIRKYSVNLGLVMSQASAKEHVLTEVFGPMIPVNDREANVEMFAKENGEN